MQDINSLPLATQQIRSSSSVVILESEWKLCSLSSSLNYYTGHAFCRILFNQVETCSLVSTKKDKVVFTFLGSSFCILLFLFFHNMQGKSNSLLCLEGFHQLLLMMITWFSPSSPAFAKSQIRQRTLSLHDFLVYVNPALRDKDSNELIHYLINFFEVSISICCLKLPTQSRKEIQLGIVVDYPFT